MLVRDTKRLQHACAEMLGEPILVLDLETSGLDPLLDTTLIIGLSDGRRTWLIDARQIAPEPLAQHLQPVLERASVVVMHHARFDLRFLLSLGLTINNPVDTLLNQQLIENGRERGRLSLSELAKRLLGIHLDKTERTSFLEQGEQAFSEAQLEYARRDLLATYQVFMQQIGPLTRQGLSEVAAIEANALNAFAAMEHRGLPIDVDAWRILTDAAERQRQEARALLDDVFRPVADLDLFRGVHINYESEHEIKDHLLRLGMEVESTARHNLLALDHPVGQRIVAYREAAKLVSTYGEGFLSHVNPKTGRIHAHFRQIGASTGRVSCSEPNLQNIPKDSAFRACVSAPSGRFLVTADYGAAELRILAQASQDKVFLEAFRKGDDLHSTVASQLFGEPVSKTENAHLRSRAKAINFGLVYGMGAGGLANQVGASLEEAERLLEKYFGRYPGVRRYLDRSVRRALKQGCARTLTGRRLWFRSEDLNASDAMGRIGRVAKNMPIQGTSADITKLAMGRLHRELAREPDAAIVNCIHDEIVVECVDGERTAALVSKVMQEAEQDILPDVPPEVDVVVDRHWAKG